MGGRAKKECTLSYGATVTTRVWRERDLPFLTPATTKRQTRIAKAFQSAVRRCFVLAIGVVPRVRGRWRYMKPIAERYSGLPVVTLGQMSAPFLGYLLTPFTAILGSIRIARKRQIKTVVQYCYFPDAFLFSLWCKIRYGSHIVLDLEDICVPRLLDWKKGSETKPLLMLWGWVLMQFSMRLADCIIVPSEKFKAVIPRGKDVAVVTGCQDVCQSTIKKSEDDRITLLMSGGITYENGMHILAGAIKKIQEEGRVHNLRVLVCGSGKMDWLKEQLFDVPWVDFLGFLSNEDFTKMYASVDVCFALENPTGRHGMFKTPSKGYEALCSGKTIIVSDIGDFGLLPDDVCYHLSDYSSESLAQIMCSLTPEDIELKRRAASEYALKHFDTRCVGEILRGKLGIPQ